MDRYIEARTIESEMTIAWKYRLHGLLRVWHIGAGLGGYGVKCVFDGQSGAFCVKPFGGGGGSSRSLCALVIVWFLM